MNILSRVKILYREYPSQYWLMILGVILSTAGGSMIWPFLLIYAGNKLQLPLSAVATLISTNAGMGIASSLIAGTLADKIGRKTVMVFSLAAVGIAYFLMVFAQTYWHFTALMIMIGISNPLYQVGADAMLADMIPTHKRMDAYALNRIANNAAFALGPAIGGFLATRSYNLAFYSAALGFVSYSLIMIFKAEDTLHLAQTEARQISTSGNDFARVLQDKRFLIIIALIGIGLIAPTLIWILMPVYAKNNFGVSEAQFGWIPTTNAIMCVFLQYPITRLTRKYKTLPIVGTGMFFYAIATGSVALMNGFWGFWLSMVILTFGELTLVPTASQYVADTAPADLRGRYMSIYWLGWGLARTLSPLVGGFLNDRISPQSIWIGGLAIGLISVLGIFLFNSLSSVRFALRSQP